MTIINQANQCFQQGNFQQAERLYRELLQANPKDVNALWGLGKIALAFDSYQSAYQMFQQCIDLHNKEPRLWLSLAETCQKLMRFDEVEQALINAFTLNEGYVPSLLALAIYYTETGNYQTSYTYLNLVLQQDTENITAFCLLVRINHIKNDDMLVNIMWQKLTQNESITSLSARNKVSLHYAFFTLFEKQSKFEQAFSQLKLANQHQHKLTGFSVDDMQPFFNSILTTFNERFINKLDALNQIDSSSETPAKVIFIVGQPRSGSTLLEQMLTGHKSINTAGELPFLAGNIAQGIFQITGQHFPEGCALLNSKNCKDLASHYRQQLQTIVPNSEYIIDKMPANYQSIGLIKMLMPDAKIIHIKRDPIDVCWSIYKNNFAATEPYYCSLPDIIKYQKKYEDVMSHWQQTTPEFIHTINYADLVNEPESQLTAVLEFCGLEYQRQCVDFAKQNRHISTLSDTQLRKGLKAVQTESWRPYQDYLMPLILAFKNS